jgi:PAS domain S-box-containing protein
MTDSPRIEAERDRFFDDSPTGITVLGFDGMVERVNEAVVHMFGWSEDELVGRSFMEFIHPDDGARALDLVTELAADHGPIEFEGRVRTRAGTYRWIRATARSVPDERLVYVWTIDVHERKQAEALMRQSEERFRCMFEDNPAGGALVDSFLRLQKANSALGRMLDRPPSTLEGRELLDVTHADDAALLARVTRRAIDGAIPGYELDVRLLHRDGSDVWVAVRASVVTDTSGQPPYVLLLIEDVREVREAERARREIDQLKDRFLRVASHDLQNPLLAITHLANIVEQAPCGVDLHHEAVRRIAAQAGRLQKMATHFLDLERLYHGSIVSARRVTDIAALVGRVVEQCDAGDHPVALEVPPLVAVVDPDQVEHIVENLLDNAIGHTPPNTPILVRVDGTDEAMDITIEDAGPGVPDQLKESVFELFRTGQPDVVRTGIGLWIVARFAELHGGRAWVEDRPGGGASFRVLLQAPPEPPGPDPDPRGRR